MGRFKKISIAILIILLGIQFIQPARDNDDAQALSTDISRIYSVPLNAQSILKASCYDCHSNYTSYPWYSYVQPVGWILEKHIRDGKEELNFSDFGTFSVRRQVSKLRSIKNSIQEGSMPLSSYSMMHKNARMTEHQKAIIIAWAKRISDSLTTKH